MKKIKEEGKKHEMSETKKKEKTEVPVKDMTSHAKKMGCKMKGC